MINIACKEGGISWEEFVGPSRKRATCDVRAALAYIIYNRVGGYSLQAIGKMFGGRDHTTIINCLKNCQEYLNSPAEANFQALYRKIFRRLSDIGTINDLDHQPPKP